MTVLDASLTFFLHQPVAYALEGRLWACEGIKSPYPMKAGGRCLYEPRRCRC